MKARNWMLGVLAAVAAAACTTLTEELPHAPDPVHGSPPPVIVIPVTIPTPAPAPPPPAATPAPPAGGAPSSPAPPSNPPSSQGCGLPAGTGSGNDCPRQSPSFLPQVESALTQFVQQEPGVFDLNDTQGCGTCYKVRNVQRYVNHMPELMEQRGLCSIYDGEELAVKNHNSFNDQYDILTSGFYIRRDQGSYRSTCYPAWF
jgi:hypothetical protein